MIVGTTGVWIAQLTKQTLRVLCSFVLGIITRSIVGRHQKSERILAYLSGQLGCEVRIDDRSRIERLKRRIESVFPFKKEWPLFVKEDRKSLIRRYNRCVCLDLREIRIDRRIERYVRRDRVFKVYSDVFLYRMIYKPPRGYLFGANPFARSPVQGGAAVV